MFGPNGTWVTFNGPGGIYVAPVHADRATEEAEWTLILEISAGSNSERTAGLSPDGGLLYVLLERDGFRCLYAMKLDVESGKARGEPFLVQHYHDATRRWGSTGMGSAVADGVFVADLFETTGNVWMTTLPRPQGP
jgi:eukaryotic-like serine/threonine-protein kinase